MAIFVAKSGQLQTVKGIFECKNMLREGVDYERYDWLVGDNTARIEWSANLWNNQLHTIIGKQQSDYLINSNYSSNTTNIRITYHRMEDLFMVIFRSGSDNSYHIADYNPFSTMPDVVDFKFYIDNGVGYCERNGSKITGHRMETYWNTDVPLRIYVGKMNLLEEYNAATNTSVTSLTPCQLLRNIPSTLDNNGKARVAGECGMYDSVSGKFFGNVASTGSFTVSND